MPSVASDDVVDRRPRRFARAGRAGGLRVSWNVGLPSIPIIIEASYWHLHLRET
jgi:hypothetical protein